KKRTRRVVELVFGNGHSYVAALFDKTDGHSLSDIRGKIAHGRFALLNREDKQTVSRRLHEMATISKEFLVRLMCKLNTDESAPQWSYLFTSSLPTSDPRSTMYTSTETILPNNDW